MQAATRRSIHSAFVQLQLQSRCRRPSLLLRQIAATRAPEDGLIIPGGSARKSVRWLSSSIGLRAGRSGGSEDKSSAEDGGVSAGAEIDAGREGRKGKGLESSSKSTSVTPGATAAGATTTSATPSSEPAASAASSNGASAQQENSPEAAEEKSQSQQQQESQSQPPPGTKPRGRPLGSGPAKRRQPTKGKDKDIPKPEVPEWFIRDGVMMVEDNLAKPTKLELWITPDKVKISRDGIQEALEFYGLQLDEDHLLAVAEQVGNTEGGVEKATEEGLIDDAATPPPPPPPPSLPPRPEGSGPKPDEGAEAAAKDVNVEGAKEEPPAPIDIKDPKVEVIKQHRFSVTMAVNKLVQVDHTLQEAFPGLSRGDQMLSAIANLGEFVESHIVEACSGKNRYAIHVYVWREIMAHVTAGLALPKASSNDSDVATKSHVLLNCPREGGLYFLDTVVEHVASLARADLIRIDPQDLEEMAGDFLGDTKYLGDAVSLSNLTGQKIRSLGYDAQSQSHNLAPPREEEAEEEEEEGGEYIDGPGETQTQSIFSGAQNLSNSPLRAMVAFIPSSSGSNLLVPANPQTVIDRRNERKVYKLLEAIIDSAAMKRVQENLPATYQDTWHADLDSPHDITSEQLADSTTPPPQKTIIHIRDYSELQLTPQGAIIIRMIHDIVSKRRKDGQPMVIIGTTIDEKLSNKLSQTSIEQSQELQADEFERTIVVPPAKSPAHEDLDEIMEADHKARIKEVNMRHLRDIIRRRSGEGKAGIKLEVPSDWHLIEEVEGGDKIEGIDIGMWDFDKTHRIATMAIGLYHKHFQSLRLSPPPPPPPPETPQQQVERQEDGEGEGATAAVVQEQEKPEEQQVQEYTPGILTVRNIATAVKAISQSDNFKFIWAIRERRRLHQAQLDELDEQEAAEAAAKSTQDDPDAIDEPEKPKGASFERMKKLAKICTPHEQKLLAGVINPDKINVGFHSVRAPPETVEALKTLTSLSLVRPDAFQYGVLATDRIPGVLLYGPPGTGKTLLAKAVAKESGATVLEVSGSEIFDMYVGEGEKNVKAIFTLATRLSPCIIFLDEADAILGSRSSSSTRTTHREIINQFLREWADLPLTPSTSTFLMVATNRPFDLDDAVLRRLPRRILVDLPTLTDRLHILKIHLRDELLAPDVDVADLAQQTPLYSGSDLKNVCVSAALAAVREEQDLFVSEGVAYPAKRILGKRHFEKALLEVGASVGEDMGSLAQMRKWDEKFGEGKGRKRGGRGIGFGGGKEEKKGVVDEGLGRVRRPVVY